VTRNAIVIALALAGALACARNPATGERQLLLVPEGQAKALGEQAAAEIVQSIGLVDNQEIQQYVANIGKQLAAKSERPELGWSFQVLDDASVNAFALPGGFIFVTRGILAHLGSEAQLASVLGHEIGHVTAKHSVDQMSKATLATLGLGVASIVSEDIAKVSQVGAAGLQVLFLKYGRDDEYQADELGIRYASRGGYDVREMPKVFEVLDRVGGESRGKLPEWLSTHPSPGNRIERIEQHIAKAGPAGGNVERQGYLRKLDGLVYGEDPRQGYFLGGRFVHPKLGFEITFPDGWKTANTAQAVLAQSPGEDAMMQLAIVKAASPDEALQKFLATEGIQAGQRADSAVPNLPSASSTFQAKTKEGVLGGLVTFVTHEGRTASWASFTAASATSTRSNSSARDSTTTRKRSRSSSSSSRLSRSAARVSSSRRARRSATVGTFSTSIFCRCGARCSSAAVLARLGQRDGHALAAGAADAADAVHVGLGRRRHVVVDDVGELVDVEAAGGHVGGDEQVGGAAAQPVHHPVALLLAHAAVQRLGPVAAAVERLGELVDLVAGAAEHDRRRRVPRRRGCGRAPPACGRAARRRRVWRTLGASPGARGSRGRW
jgi:predicted Zn-dependent protease